MFKWIFILVAAYLFYAHWGAVLSLYHLFDSTYSLTEKLRGLFS